MILELNPNPPPPNMVLVPASVLENWMNEFKKFCPSLIVVKYHGTQAERRTIQSRLNRCKPTIGGSNMPNTQRLKLDIVLTTFSYFSSEKADDRQVRERASLAAEECEATNPLPPSSFGAARRSF